MSVWKVYVRESLSHVIQASTSSFYTALGTHAENHAAAYTLQAYDGEKFFKSSHIPIAVLILSIPYGIPVILCCSLLTEYKDSLWNKSSVWLD